MQKKFFIGIDVSKSKVDIAVLSFEKEVQLEKIVLNNPARLKSFFTALTRKLKLAPNDLFVCCENTGIYGRHLELVCVELGIDLWVENPLKIKRASTDFRGKTDAKDALRIAQYAIRYQDKALLHREKDPLCKQLNDLLNAREDLLEQVVSLKQRLNESKVFSPETHRILKKAFNPVLKVLEKQIEQIEEQVDKLSSQNQDIARNKELLESITGIGEHNALQFIIHTENFTRFKTANHLACYVGVVPFPNESGTIKKRDRISKQAKTSLKKLLHLAAMAAIRAKGDLKDYFIRKVKEGKNKMSILNAIRNKLVHRMFAVIKRGTPYVVGPAQLSTSQEI